MKWNETKQWIKRIQEIGVPERHVHSLGVSAAGAREALKAALDAIQPATIDKLALRPCHPYKRVTMVAASTVLTAPLEWLVVLLGSGSEVILKRPEHGLFPWEEWVEAAEGLPLQITTDKTSIYDSELVIVMGTDATVQEVKAQLDPSIAFLGFGHRFSMAWVTGAPLQPDSLVPENFQDPWDSLAADAALHDGRGCLSPTIVFTLLPLGEALQHLQRAMSKAQSVWPLGQIYDVEGANIRARSCLARVVGQEITGDGFSLHGLPPQFAQPGALPRSLTVTSVSSLEEAIECIRPFAHALSTVGTDDFSSETHWRTLGASRICRLGRMQRPQLERIHDGLDWTKVIRREN